MKKDLMGDRFKQYERAAETIFPALLPIILRIDGRGFSKLTKRLGMNKPFDDRFTSAMITTTLELLDDIQNVRFAYTQSDEISILMYPRFVTSSPWFGNRAQKICSVAASMAAGTFNSLMSPLGSAAFDCRAFVIPPHDIGNYFLWRQGDAFRNCVSAYAQKHIGKKQLFGKSTAERIEMLRDEGVEMYSIPLWNIYGTSFWKENNYWTTGNLTHTPTFFKDNPRCIEEPTLPEERETGIEASL
jgi:tRNA(His) 5'-end guanylyltransferase